MLDLESEVLGSILTGSNIFVTGFFCLHVVKPLMSILALLPMLCVCKNWNAELNHRKIVVVMSLTAEGLKTFSCASVWTVPLQCKEMQILIDHYVFEFLSLIGGLLEYAFPSIKRY